MQGIPIIRHVYNTIIDMGEDMNTIYNSIMHAYNKVFKHNKDIMILSCMVVNNKIIPMSIAIKQCKEM